MSALPNPVPNARSQRLGQHKAARAQRRLQSVSHPVRSGATQPTSQRAHFWESSLILGMNGVLIGTALITLAQLIPFQVTQQAKLKEISAEQAQVSQNLQRLKQDYQRGQLPESALRIAEDQGNLMKANRKQIYWMPQPPTAVQ
jgi:cytoskeletal protein RodZ